MELDFKYWDRNEWSEYIEECIKPIRDKTDNLLRFRDYLAENHSSMSILSLREYKSLLIKSLSIDLNKKNLKRR